MTDRIVSFGIVSAAIIGLIAAGLFLFGQPLLAKAGLTTFAAPCKTAAATTTLSYMTAGLATTTLTCGMGNDGADTAVVAIQVNASSSLTVFNVYAEESMDGIDWYPIAQDQTASTTSPFGGAVRQYTSFAFASSTVGGGLLGNLFGASTTFEGFTAVRNRNHYVFNIPVRMKQVRTYVGITGAAGAVWMQIQPKAGI